MKKCYQALWLVSETINDKREGGRATAVGPCVGTFPDLGEVKSKARSSVAEGLKLPSGYAAALGCFLRSHCVHLHGQTLQEDSYDFLDPATVSDRRSHENKWETADMLTAPYLAGHE